MALSGPLEIRDERPEDAADIRQVTYAAFQAAEQGGQAEADIITALRAAGALSVSLVAVVDGRIVGHVAFSPVTIDGAPRGWYGLGPVSVVPDMQKRGIGGALIRTGLERLRQVSARGCVVLGEPGYYGRFGFGTDPSLVLEGVPAGYFMRLTLEGETPSGVVEYHSAFAAALS